MAPLIILVDETGGILAASNAGAAGLMKSLDAGAPLIKAEPAPKAEPSSAPAEQEQLVPHFAAHHDDLRRSTKDKDEDGQYGRAADLMRSGNADALREHLRSMDPGQRDEVLDHIHPNHWEGLGFRPVDQDGAEARFSDRFAPDEGTPKGEKDTEGQKGHSGAKGTPRGKKDIGAPKIGGKPGEKPMAKAMLFTSDATALAVAVHALRKK